MLLPHVPALPPHGGRGPKAACRAVQWEHSCMGGWRRAPSGSVVWLGPYCWHASTKHPISFGSPHWVEMHRRRVAVLGCIASVVLHLGCTAWSQGLRRSEGLGGARLLVQPVPAEQRRPGLGGGSGAAPGNHHAAEGSAQQHPAHAAARKHCGFKPADHLIRTSRLKSVAWLPMTSKRSAGCHATDFGHLVLVEVPRHAA